MFKSVTLHHLVCLALVYTVLASCTKSNVGNNELSDAEKADGWQLLFDGKSTEHWHLYNKEKMQSAWMITSEGALYCDPTNISVEHGDLLTDKEYTNFEFVFEWKLSEAGNSGVFINVQERDSIPVAWATGPEYQLLDKAHYDYDKTDKRSGCLYGLAPQKNPVDQKPNGEWNQARIKQVNGKVEFYLNGKLTAEQDFTTQEWKDKVASTGFKNFPEFGKYTSGHIALQDWAKGVYFRNLKIKEL